MSSRMGLLAAVGLGTFAVAYGMSQSSNTSKHASPANQSRPATNSVGGGSPGDLSVKGVERSGGGV